MESAHSHHISSSASNEPVTPPGSLECSYYLLVSLRAIKITGNGRVNVSVTGNSKIEFNRFNFVELRGRTGHEGLFPIKGEPLANTEHSEVANVFGNVSSAVFEFRTKAGDLIREINLTKGGG